MGSMLTVNQAIRDNRKIGFKYQKYSLSNRSQQIDRRKGAEYIFSPYKLIINDGNYYLLAYDSKRQMMKTFRLDRMKEVRIKEELPRDGQEVYAQMDMQTYCLQHFGMFNGDTKWVQLRFTNNLLDTVVDRFGTGADVFYGPDGDRHFIVTTEIAISDQFFGWLCGFRKMAKIVSPPDVVADFRLDLPVNHLHRQSAVPDHLAGILPADRPQSEAEDPVPFDISCNPSLYSGFVENIRIVPHNLGIRQNPIKSPKIVFRHFP
jgi:predicted DNA-binding transcriptional regulator YafY